jgi:hypothetical protein
MSGKSAKKVKKQTPPRSWTDIQRAGQELYIKAGQCQYHIEVLQAQLKQLNSQLLQVNQEAGIRQELDKAAQVPEKPKDEAPTAEVQSA